MTRRRGRLAASAACLVALALTAPAAHADLGSGLSGISAADVIFEEPVPFHAVLGAFPSGSLRHSTLRTHRVVVVPLYFTKRPDRAAITEMVRQTRAFYAREVPGMRLQFKVLPPVRTTHAKACTYEAAWGLAVGRSGFGSLSEGEHVVVVAPECAEAGIASEAPGYGRVFVSVVEGQVLAHEFGHNLGLKHGDIAICTSGEHAVALSRTCKEFAYEDLGDVMGGGIRGSSLLAGRRLPGVEQALLTGRVRTVVADRESSLAITSRGTGTHAAQVGTAFGTVFLDVAPDDGFVGVPNSVQAHLATRNGSALLRLPQPDGSMQPVRTGLQLGDSWSIPGTRLRVVVTSLASTRAGLHFSPASARTPKPAAAVITAPTDGLAPTDTEWAVTWQGPAETGIVAYQVQVGDTIVARVPGTATQALVPPIDAPTTVIVWAVGLNGLRSPSAPLAVTPDDQWK